MWYLFFVLLCFALRRSVSASRPAGQLRLATMFRRLFEGSGALLEPRGWRLPLPTASAADDACAVERDAFLSRCGEQGEELCPAAATDLDLLKCLSTVKAGRRRIRCHGRRFFTIVGCEQVASQK